MKISTCAGLVLALALGLSTTQLQAVEQAPPETNTEADSPSSESEELSFLEALRGGEPEISLRYRFETVETDALARDAYASTLRSTLGYRTAPFHGFSLFAQLENVVALFDDDTYRNAGAGSLFNGVTDRPVIADPELTEVLQVYLRHQRGPFTTTLGRQEINLGDQRFVGAVGWRQHHQSFDALRFEAEVHPRVQLDYAYLDEVHRIFGDSQPMSSHLLTVPVSLGGEHRLRLYDYLLDYDRPADAGRSSTTYGTEYTGARELGGGWKLSWEAELAEQRDAGDNPRDLDTGYRNASLALGRGGYSARLTWEVLEGGRGGAFQTPLATLHKWNGWADQFLNTPSAGLETLYFQLAGPAGPIRWTVIYLDFQAEAVDRDYGSEIDAQLTWKSSWGQAFGLKLAFYDADTFSSDTEKAMLWTAFSF
ncbi:MAG: alginate export family protein [Acidobacteriota bacterium]|nr:alginate export family protein [Acidobacteriota bacterium]